MGVYLVPTDLANLDLSADGACATIDEILTSAGLPGLETVAGRGPGFEEKVDVSPRAFDAALAGIEPTDEIAALPSVAGATPAVSPASGADVWLPIAFSGVITVPGVPGTYHEELRLASAVDIAARCRALGATLGFPWDDVPALEPTGYTLSAWYHSPAASAAGAQCGDPEVAYTLALYSSVADYAVRHSAAVGYA